MKKLLITFCLASAIAAGLASTLPSNRCLTKLRNGPKGVVTEDKENLRRPQILLENDRIKPKN